MDKICAVHTVLSTYEHKTRIKVCGQASKKCIFWVRVLEKHGSSLSFDDIRKQIEK